MTKIPDILKGTEAVPFISWYNRYRHIDRPIDWKQKNVDSVHAFLCGDFRPEMIPEIFQEWSVCGVSMFEITNGDDLMDYYPRQGGRLVIQMPNLVARSSYPKTLNQFISDVSRAGITLKYK